MKEREGKRISRKESWILVASVVNSLEEVKEQKRDRIETSSNVNYLQCQVVSERQKLMADQIKIRRRYVVCSVMVWWCCRCSCDFSHLPA